VFLRPGFVSLCLAIVSIAAPVAAEQPERRWIVDNSAAKSGDGSASSPFTALADAVKASAEGDVIVVRATKTPYAGTIALRSGQMLIGEGGTPVLTGADGDVITISGTTTPVMIANVNVRASGSSGAVVIRDARGAVTLRDVSLSTGGGTGLLVAKAAKFVVTGTSVESTDAPALSIDGAELDAAFRGVSAGGTKRT
jgi:hypothetical protein